MSDVSVIVATCGDRKLWNEMADRACTSVEKQTYLKNVELARVHKDTLHEARNSGVEGSSGKWIIVLDADDELHPEYIESMLAGSGDLRYPMLQQYVNGVPDDPRDLHRSIPSLMILNYICIGAMVRREQFLNLGGFRDLPAYEDWDLWLRFWIDGADIRLCQNAIYKQHVRRGSRNDLPEVERCRLHKQIFNEYEPLARAKGLVA